MYSVTFKVTNTSKAANPFPKSFFRPLYWPKGLDINHTVTTWFKKISLNKGGEKYLQWATGYNGHWFFVVCHTCFQTHFACCCLSLKFFRIEIIIVINMLGWFEDSLPADTNVTESLANKIGSLGLCIVFWTMRNKNRPR